MTRKCSHCSHNGHNSRTCPNRGVKLFGVRLTDGIRKCASMGNLSHYAGTSGAGGGGASPQDGPEVAEDGYGSEDLVQGTGSGSRERKKGIPWTEEEHRMFLLGLQKLGKGDWRGIARNFVVSRTPTQVASHAQKYFIRQTNANRRKRRSSLFDIVVDEPAEASNAPMCEEPTEMHENHPLPQPPPLDEECESMESTNSNDAEVVHPKPEIAPCSYPMVFSAYFPPFFPYSIPLWQNYSEENLEKVTHEVIKPTPIYSKEPIDVNELVGMSQLSIGESSLGEPASDLSLKLRGGQDRQSAFHANPSASSSNVNSSSNPVHAV